MACSWKLTQASHAPARVHASLPQPRILCMSHSECATPPAGFGDSLTSEVWPEELVPELHTPVLEALVRQQRDITLQARATVAPSPGGSEQGAASWFAFALTLPLPMHRSTMARFHGGRITTSTRRCPKARCLLTCSSTGPHCWGPVILDS